MTRKRADRAECSLAARGAGLGSLELLPREAARLVQEEREAGARSRVASKSFRALRRRSARPSESKDASRTLASGARVAKRGRSTRSRARRSPSRRWRCSARSPISRASVRAFRTWSGALLDRARYRVLCAKCASRRRFRAGVRPAPPAAALRLLELQQPRLGRSRARQHRREIQRVNRAPATRRRAATSTAGAHRAVSRIGRARRRSVVRAGAKSGAKRARSTASLRRWTRAVRGVRR